MPLDFSSQAQPLDFSSQAEPLDFSAGAVAVASAPGEFLTRGQTPQGFLSAEHVRQLSEPREAPAFDLLANQRAELADMEARRNSPEERAKDEMVARWSTIANPVSPLDVARARSVVGTAFEFLTRDPNANPTGQTFTEALGERDVSPTGFDKAAAGVQQVAAGLTSPETITFMAATAGLGALPVAAQRAASLGFAGWMAANAGTQAAELEQAVKDDDVEAAARATAGLGLDSLFAGLSAKHGLQGIAARNPRLAGWLSKRFVQEVPPEQVRGVLDRAAAGTATAGELEVAGLLRSAGIADAAGAGGVTLRGQVPRVGPAFQDWLGVPNGRGVVEVRDGRPVNPVDRLLLETAAQSPRPQTPLSTSPALRGEAAMETRPTAEMGLDRTQPSTLNPELSTDLAETIEALRAGYRPEVETIVAATVQPASGGKVFDAATHAQGFEAMTAEFPGLAPESVIAGFRTSTGRVVSREEAARIAGIKQRRAESETLPEPVAAPFPPYAEKLGIKSWQQAKKLGLDTIIADAPDMAREVVRAASNWIYASPERAAEHIAGEIVTKTRLLGGRDTALRSLANDYYQKAKGATEPGQQQRFNATAQALETLRAAKAAPAPPAKPTTPAPPAATGATAQKMPWEKTLGEALGKRDEDVVWKGNQDPLTPEGQAHRQAVEQAVAEGKPVPPNVLKDYPWLEAERNIKPYVESLRGMSDKELKVEEKRTRDELNKWAKDNPAFLPDGRLNPLLGKVASHETSARFNAVNREIDARKETAPTAATGETGQKMPWEMPSEFLKKAAEHDRAAGQYQSELAAVDRISKAHQAANPKSKNPYPRGPIIEAAPRLGAFDRLYEGVERWQANQAYSEVTAASFRLLALAERAGMTVSVETSKWGSNYFKVTDGGEFAVAWRSANHPPVAGTTAPWIHDRAALAEVSLKIESRAALRQPGGSKPTGVTDEPSLSRPLGATPGTVSGESAPERGGTVKPDFSLAPAESVAQQTARLAQEQAGREAKAQQDKLAELQAKPLQGTSGDLGQGDLLAGPQDLFAPPSPTGAGGGSGHASVGDFRAPVPAQAASKPQAAADAGFAESGLFVDGVEVRLGGSEAVNPVLLPEMYRLFHELTGGESPFLRRYRKANGMFYGEGAGRIGLHPDLFKFPHQVAYTFAHELGHLVDYLPDRALDRGNVLGRIGALRGWLTTTFPLHPKTSLDEVLKPNDRAKLRREAEKAIGPKPGDKTDAAAWQEQVSERYGEMVEQEIEARGLISLKQVRDELLAVSQWWRPYDPATATESYRAYRESGVELYADALSVLFNSPGHLEQKAPTFYKAFWNWLDAKPEFKAALARVQELLGKGDAEVLRARVADDRADFAKGRETFEAAHAEQERLWSDPKEVLRRLERQLLDKGAELERLAKAERGGGVLPVGPDLREKWEQMNMADNLIYQFSARLVRDVVKPLQDAGLDANTDLGIYLKHARIQGNKSAREELDVLKARLGRPVYLLAEKFADLMEELERKGLAETMMIDKVILPAESAGIEFEDITELARLRIEQGTRADLANPRMVQAKESERTLNQYLSDLGPAKAAVLKQAVQAFHDEVFKLVEHGHRAGIFTDRQLALAAVNKDTYAAFRPLEYVDTYVQPTMRKAKGSAKPIENPFVTTMLKMQSLADLIMRQESLNTTRDTMQRLDPEAFKLAETFWTPNGKQARSAPRDRVRLVVREQGKPVAYDVDPAIAEAYQKLSPYEQNVAARWVNWLFHQSLYKGYVSWSLPFNLWNNPWRDVSRTQLNMAAVFGKRAPSVPELARAYKDAWDSAKKYTQGELTPLSQEALDFYAIYAPTDAFYAQFPEDNASHAIMVKLGLAPEPPNRLRTLAGKIPVVKQAVAFGDFIMHEGQKREAVGKLGPWLALQRAGVNPEQAAAFVRNYVGTPNIKSAGSQSYIPNAIFPFYRIYSQAARTWVRLARNPQTRGGYFYQWAITRGTLRALLGLAGLGAFGTAAKQWIDGVPEYERTRGIPLPLPPGSQPGGDYGSKSVFLRIPDDEFSALLGYSLDNAIRAAAGQKEPGKAASDAAKQWLTSAPGLNTYADLASQWMAYAGGGEPRDNFRGRPVLSEAERKAGGTAALGKMAQFTADKSGIPFMRQNPTEPTSTPEAVLRFVPLLKDIVKVTDAGFREKDQAQRDAVEQVKYAIRMDYGDNTKFLLHRHAQLDRAGTTRTLPQEADYRYLQAWHSTYNRFDAAVVDAQQRGEKGAAKERIAALERLSASTKTALDTGHAARDAAATGGHNLPWSPRLTNAVPVRR